MAEQLECEGPTATVTLKTKQEKQARIYNASLIPVCGTSVFMQIDANMLSRSPHPDDEVDSDDHLMEFLQMPAPQQSEAPKRAAREPVKQLGISETSLVLNQKQMALPGGPKAKPVKRAV